MAVFSTAFWLSCGNASGAKGCRFKSCRAYCGVRPRLDTVCGCAHNSGQHGLRADSWIDLLPLVADSDQIRIVRYKLLLDACERRYSGGQAKAPPHVARLAMGSLLSRRSTSRSSSQPPRCRGTMDLPRGPLHAAIEKSNRERHAPEEIDAS
jgi:hypothetical protein